MPGERAHTWATLALAAALVPVSPAVAAGALVGLAVDPDLDMARAGSRSRLRRFSRPLARAWSLAWEPYDRMARHRGASHWPVAGTLGRAGYAAVATGFAEDWREFAACLGLQVAAFSAMFLARDALPLALLGLCLSDLLHIIMDWGWSAWKSFWR